MLNLFASVGLSSGMAPSWWGKLACFDRMIIFGTLRGLCHPGLVTQELQASSGEAPI